MRLTPKAEELLEQMELGRSYNMSCMGDLIFRDNPNHSRQTIALKASRFARQLIDQKLITDSQHGYQLTHVGSQLKLSSTGK